jgi:hypothetical protein
MQAITEFDGLHVESKAGIFLANDKKKSLHLLTTFGLFSQEFLEKEKEVPYRRLPLWSCCYFRKTIMDMSSNADVIHYAIKNKLVK